MTLHGGEPTLIGVARAAAFFDAARAGLEGVAHVRLAIQTNATRLTPRSRHQTLAGNAVSTHGVWAL